MKQLICAVAVLFLCACNSESESSSSEDTSITNMSGVENVNGNIPDTSNSMTVEGSSQSSDVSVDTTKQKK